jgi:hypothetical protein
VYDACDTQSGTDADRSRAAAAENRVRVLEKQRAELMEGFRKQLKLIDILKRQKVTVCGSLCIFVRFCLCVCGVLLFSGSAKWFAYFWLRVAGHA